ncbi:MAG: hypothetical protein AAF394_14145, partial [Planctomycetota bacterium]
MLNACPDDAQLSQFLSGQLDPIEFESICAHVDSCELCQSRVESLACERFETTIRKGQLWFAGALVRQKETRLPKRLMNDGRRLTAQGPKEAGRPPKQW